MNRQKDCFHFWHRGYWVRLGRFEGVPEEGGLLSTTATVMVGVLRVLIPMVVHVDTCTVEGVLLEF